MSIRKYWPITKDDVYVRVFDEILEEATADLIDENLTRSYTELCPHSRHIVTRMYLRTPKWIRFEDLSKYVSPETLKDQVLPELTQSGWLQQGPSLQSLVLEVATQKELVEVAKALGLKVSGSNKSKLESQLLQLEKQQALIGGGSQMKTENDTGLLRSITKIAKAIKIDCYLLSPEHRKFLFELEQLFLYPVGPDATLEIMFLKHMKKHQFLKYDYISQRDKRIFASKLAFEAYVSARVIARKIEEAVQSNKVELHKECVEQNLLQLVLSGFYKAKGETFCQAAMTYGRCIFTISQIYMKLHMFHEEYSWVQKYLDQTIHTSKRGLTYIRKLLLEIRFLTESQTKGESSWLVSAINTYYDAQNEVNEIEMLDLQRKTGKLLASIRNTGLQSALAVIRSCELGDSRTKIPVFNIIAKPVVLVDSPAGPGTRVFYDGGLTVEKLALLKYAEYDSGAYNGEHFEGSILTTIFWLLAYDLLFQDSEQFRCAYQSHPMNLQATIDRAYPQIMERIPDLRNHVLKNRRTLVDIGEPLPLVGGISWFITEKSIDAILRGLADKSQHLILRLITNYRKYSSGFPDLTLWNSEGKTKFVEVKSENDTVSDNQQLWMEFMLEHGIDVEICKVLPVKQILKRKRT